MEKSFQKNVGEYLFFAIKGKIYSDIPNQRLKKAYSCAIISLKNKQKREEL